jgi:predicted transcriptional regulator YheO
MAALAYVSTNGYFKSSKGVIRRPMSCEGASYPIVMINRKVFTFSVLVNAVINRGQWTPEKTLTEHKDNDKTNNKSDNLKFGSHSTNTQASIDAGRSSHSDQTSKPILGAMDGTEDWVEYKNVRVAAKELNVSRSTIYNVLARKFKNAKGYKFKYKEQPDLLGEVWKDAGYGCQVSNKMRYQDSKGVVKVPKAGEDGYRRVVMNGNQELFHRVVALAFCPNDDPVNKTEVDHLDMDPSNCLPQNLEWVTHAENIRRSYQNNKKRKSSGPAQSKPVKAIKADGSFAGQYDNAYRAADALGMSQHSVRRSAKSHQDNVNKYTKGYRFEYIPDQAEDGEEWFPVTQGDLDFILTKCHGAHLRKP